MKAGAICLRCGDWKKASYSRCDRCGFQPISGSDDELKSVYLSFGRFSEAEDQQAYKEDLENRAPDIRNGAPIEFDAGELQRLAEQRDLFRSISPARVWIAVFRFFAPAVVFLAALALLLWILCN